MRAWWLLTVSGFLVIAGSIALYVISGAALEDVEHDDEHRWWNDL